MAIHITSKTRPLKRPKPTSKEQLQSIIKDELERQGPNADLNFIDVSEITDMFGLFFKLDIRNIKIDEWDTSNVEDMSHMFCYCRNFNADLSRWDVSNVTDMQYMFCECRKFNCDLSSWNMRNLIGITGMFDNCYAIDTSKLNCP